MNPLIPLPLPTPLPGLMCTQLTKFYFSVAFGSPFLKKKPLGRAYGHIFQRVGSGIRGLYPLLSRTEKVSMQLIYPSLVGVDHSIKKSYFVLEIVFLLVQ